MKIIWVNRVDVDTRSHITTWRETHRYLSKHHEIHYIFPYKNRKESFSRNTVFVKTLSVPYVKRVMYIASSFIHFIALSRRIDADVVILDPWSFFYSVRFLFKRKKPIIVLDNRSAEFYEHTNEETVKNIILKSFTALMLRWNRRFHSGITYISEALKQQFEQELNIKVDKPYCVWPSGVDTALFDPARYETKQDNDCFTLLFHGSVTENRGLAECLRALKLLDGEEIKWTIVASGGDAYLKQLKSIAEEIEILHRVEFLDDVDYQEIPKFIARADLCVMTYPALKYWEGNVPIKLLEYMAMEKPVICTDLKVFREITRSNPSTVFIKNNEPETIAQGIRYAMSHKDHLARQGRCARRIAREEYSWSTISYALHNFLLSLHAGQTQPL